MRDLNPGELDARIMGIRAGGSTDLSAGYLLGLREAGRATAALGSVGATVLVVSDGHVNAGIADPVILAGLAQKAQQDDSVTTSTVGFGLGYDEVLLEAVTRGGNGTHRFAPDVDAATREIADLVGDLLGKSVVGAMMRIRPQLGAVGGVSLRQDLPNWVEADAVVVNLGDLYGGEERRTLFRLHVPAVAALGTATVAVIEFEYTSLPDLRHHTITLPVSVNVVPGDEARNRVPNPIVEVESLIADIDAEKKAIATSLRSGDSETARRSLGTAISNVNAKRADLRATSAEPSLTQRLDDVAAELLGLADDVMHRGAEYSSKSFTDSYSSSSRGRKGKGKPDVTPLTDTDGGGGSGPAA
jgi:Ca-activated chloride channel family protein